MSPLEFIRALFGEGRSLGTIELTALYPGKNPPKARTYTRRVAQHMRWYTLEDALDEMRRCNDHGYGVHFGLTTRRPQYDEDLGEGWGVARGGEDTAWRAPAVWADIDLTHEDERPAAYDRLMGLTLPPSMVVNSGGGYHAYWRLIHSVDCTDDFKARTLSGWMAHIGSDMVNQYNRMLRLPGYDNTKYDPPRPVELIHYDETLIYTVADFTPYRAPPPSPRLPSTRPAPARVGEDEDLISAAKNADALGIIGSMVPLKRAAHTEGGEYAGPCPICNAGEDRLRVWPHHSGGYARWWCRQCDNAGDLIDLIRLAEGVSFDEAIERLTGRRLTGQVKSTNFRDKIRRA